MTILNKILIFKIEKECRTCDGSGKIGSCRQCNGLGKVHEAQGGTNVFSFVVGATAILSLIAIKDNIWSLAFFIPFAILSLLTLKEYKEQVTK